MSCILLWFSLIVSHSQFIVSIQPIINRSQFIILKPILILAISVYKSLVKISLYCVIIFLMGKNVLRPLQLFFKKLLNISEMFKNIDAPRNDLWSNFGFCLLLQHEHIFCSNNLGRCWYDGALMIFFFIKEIILGRTDFNVF